MYTVREMIARIRKTIHDEKEIEYDDVELNNYLDAANRIMRRTIMSLRPDLLSRSMDGYLLEHNDDGTDAFVDTVSMETPIARIIRATIDGVEIAGISSLDIQDFTAEGRPVAYYITGFDTIHFYPKPNDKYRYQIDYIADMTSLGIEDSSEYPMVLDDLLIEYVVMRTSISDEFRMEQESRLVASLVAQIEDVLRNIVSSRVMVNGYWDGYMGRW